MLGEKRCNAEKPEKAPQKKRGEKYQYTPDICAKNRLRVYRDFLRELVNSLVFSLRPRF